jgi:hypothetical protein
MPHRILAPQPRRSPADPDAGHRRTDAGLFERWLRAHDSGDWSTAATIRRDLSRTGYAISLGRPYRLVERPSKPWSAPLAEGPRRGIFSPGNAKGPGTAPTAPSPSRVAELTEESTRAAKQRAESYSSPLIRGEGRPFDGNSTAAGPRRQGDGTGESPRASGRDGCGFGHA